MITNLQEVIILLRGELGDDHGGGATKASSFHMVLRREIYGFSPRFQSKALSNHGFSRCFKPTTFDTLVTSSPEATDPGHLIVAISPAMKAEALLGLVHHQPGVVDQKNLAQNDGTSLEPHKSRPGLSQQAADHNLPRTWAS